MKLSNAYIKSATNLALAILGLFIFVIIVPKLLSFFMPFVVAAVIAAIASPAVRLLERKLKIKWKIGTACVVVFVITVILLAGYALGSFMASQISGLIEDLPEMWISLQEELNLIGQKYEKVIRGLPKDIQIMLEGLSEQTTGLAAEAFSENSLPSMERMGNIVEKLPDAFVSIVMGLLASYFFTAEKESLYNFYEDYIPAGVQKYCHMIKESMTGAVGGYFKAQFKIEGWIYLIVVAGLWLIGIRYALLLGIAIAIVDLLPIFGAGTVLLPWAFFSLLGNDYRKAIGLLAIWIVTLILRQVIQPKIVGDSIGISSIPTLFLFYIGYKVAGVMGMILAVPIGIIVINLYQAGVFDTITNSFRILCAGFNRFRHLTKEDIQLAYSEDVTKKGKYIK